MLLDAQTFELSVTPEVALSLVQKEVSRSGHKDLDVQQIRLFYTPFWVFTFDVEGAAQPISGKTALNASSGDVSEFVPVLIDRPLNKTKRTAENVESEIEATAVDRREVEKVAQARVAAQIGVRKEQVSVSAFQKFYIPFYRVWFSVAGTPMKAEVDGCLGAVFGLEGVPKKQKSMDDVTRETLEKMKSPSGWAELAGRTVDAATGAATGKGGGNKGALWLGLIAVILIFLFLSMGSKSSVTASCHLYPQYVKTDLNLFIYKTESVRPALLGVNNTKYVEGECSLTTKSKSDEIVLLPIYIRIDGSDSNRRLPRDASVKVVAGDFPTKKDFHIEWIEDDGKAHTYEFVQK